MFTHTHPAIPQPWFERYDALAADIRKRAGGRKILLVTHKGNWGDALIVDGARNFLRWHGFDYTELRNSRAIGRDLRHTVAAFPPDRAYPVFTAGGAISPLYGHLNKLRAATHAYAGGVILPATCGLPFDDLEIHPDSSLWVRERGESLRNHPDGPFCHDMAFFTPARRFPKLRRLGVFMRRDRERPPHAGTEGLDLSALGSDRSPTWPFLAIVGAHRRIRTNRLHIGIASAICGVSCELSVGSTSKIADVYDVSLSKYGQDIILV